MLRVAATIRHGYLPASTLVARLQASARQNHLTQAIQEYGRIAKTISILRYLDNPEHRRRILVQLNKGETLHAYPLPQLREGSAFQTSPTAENTRIERVYDFEVPPWLNVGNAE
jgi:hypothetical protein